MTSTGIAPEDKGGYYRPGANARQQPPAPGTGEGGDASVDLSFPSEWKQPAPELDFEKTGSESQGWTKGQPAEGNSPLGDRPFGLFLEADDAPAPEEA